MYPNADGIFHAQASLHSVSHRYDIRLHCHFKLGFGINLLNSALVLSQVMLQLGARIKMANGGGGGVHLCPLLRTLWTYGSISVQT